MDPISVFGVPMLGAVYQLLVNTGWESFTRWNDGRKKEAIPAPTSGVLVGQLDELHMNPDFASMARIFKDLDFLRNNYEPAGPFDPDDAKLLAALSRLRANLEVLFGQHFTFEGEDRPKSGSRVRIRQDATDVHENSKVIAVQTDTDNLDIEVEQKAENITGGSQVIGYTRGGEQRDR
jgi:hypothetical protein